MRSTIPRFLAAVLLLVQLQHLPGAVVCAAKIRNGVPACDDMGMSSGPAVAAAQEPGTVVCTGLGPCAPPIPVVAPVAVVTSLAGDILSVGTPGVPARPADFEPAPVPPPPRA